MTGSPLPAPIPGSTDWRDRPSFIASHRASALCQREFARVTEEVAKRVLSLQANGETEPAVVSHSPGRCMVQLGPVALTLTWLRSKLDVVADGALLAVVWRGVVGARAQPRHERTVVGKVHATAAPIWEDSLVAVAESEASWRWRSTTTEAGECTSLELAERCMEQLLASYMTERQLEDPTAAVRRAAVASETNRMRKAR